MATEKFGDFQQFLDVQEDTTPESGIDMLLANMPADKARLLRLCAIPHQFHARILMTLDISLDEDVAQQRCDEFSRLTVVNESEFGLALHDSARKQLFKMWLEPEHAVEFRAASERLKNYLITRFDEIPGDSIWSAQRAYIFHLIGYDQDAGFGELSLRFNQASEQYALEECEILVKLASEYDPVLSSDNRARLSYLDAKLATDQQRWKDAVRSLKDIVATSGLKPEIYVKAYERLGMVYQTNRNWDRAIGHFNDALELTRRESALSPYSTRILQNVGAVYREKGDFDKAERILNQCISMNSEPFNSVGLATSYNALGILHQQLRNTSAAIEAFTSALAALAGSGNDYRTAQIYNNLGLLYADMRQWSQSEKAFRKSLSVKEALEDEYGQGKTITNLARISAQRGDFDEAISMSEKAIRLFTKLRARYSLAMVHRNTGKIYKVAKQPELADKHFRIAADLFRAIDDESEANVTEAELHAVHHKDKLPWPIKAAFWIFGLAILLIIILAAADF